MCGEVGGKASGEDGCDAEASMSETKQGNAMEGDEDRLGVLVEKSLRGALTEDEQRELGALMSGSSESAEAAQRAQEEDRTMQKMIEMAAERFDPEVAQRVIDFELRKWRWPWRVSVLLVVTVVVFAVVFEWMRNGWSDLRWAYIFGLSAFICIVGGLNMLVMRRWAQREAREAMQGPEELERVYRRRIKAIPRMVLMYRIVAVGSVVVPGAGAAEALMDGTEWRYWAAWMLLMLPNLYFAFNRKYIDRLSGVMAGVIDPEAERAARRTRKK